MSSGRPLENRVGSSLIGSAIQSQTPIPLTYECTSLILIFDTRGSAAKPEENESPESAERIRFNRL